MFHDYKNDTIQTALYKAFSSIFEILSEARLHPLITLFKNHLDEKRKDFEDTYSYTADDEAKDFLFTVPILPGDASLIEMFLAEIAALLKEHTGVAPDNHLLDPLGDTLFRLVVLRVYLRRGRLRTTSTFSTC